MEKTIDLQKIFEDLKKRVEAGNFEGLTIVTPIEKEETA